QNSEIGSQGCPYSITWLHKRRHVGLQELDADVARLVSHRNMSRTIVDQEQNVSLLAPHPIIELSHPFGPQLCHHPGLSVVAVIKWWVDVCWILLRIREASAISQ
ncbi:unnamed protein product, partial [Mycena citricolor]